MTDWSLIEGTGGSKAGNCSNSGTLSWGFRGRFEQPRHLTFAGGRCLRENKKKSAHLRRPTTSCWLHAQGRWPALPDTRDARLKFGVILHSFQRTKEVELPRCAGSLQRDRPLNKGISIKGGDATSDIQVRDMLKGRLTVEQEVGWSTVYLTRLHYLRAAKKLKNVKDKRW